MAWLKQQFMGEQKHKKITNEKGGRREIMR
jgi:hypothetical protein